MGVGMECTKKVPRLAVVLPLLGNLREYFYMESHDHRCDKTLSSTHMYMQYHDHHMTRHFPLYVVT